MYRYIIRPANVTDAAAIAEVHVGVSREVYGGFVSTLSFGTFTVDVRTKQWHDIIVDSNTSPCGGVYVADIKERGVVGFGYCSLQRCSELSAKGFDGEFQSIYVLESSRRRGLGQRLMAKMAHHFIRRNIRGASCWVLRENASARKFYEAPKGDVVDEKRIELDERIIRIELAYGWPDLNVFTCSDESVDNC